MFAPAAAVIAWRYSGVTLRKLATYSMVLTGVGLVGWFVYLAVIGSTYADSIHDRVMHSLGVVFGSISFPILQFLLATVIVVSWPRKYEFRPADPIAVAETNPQ